MNNIKNQKQNFTMESDQMTKSIKTTQGIFELTLEEVLANFDGMAKQFAHKCTSKLENYENNAYDYDDYYQMALMVMMELYKKYDLSKGACFSTLAHRELNNKQIMIIRELEAEKRKNTQPYLYLNKEIDGCEVANIVKSKSDDCFEDADNLESFLLRNLTTQERLFIAIMFKKEINKAKGSYKKSIEYAVSFFADDIIEIDNIGKQELAEMLDMSRPTLNKRIKETYEKVKFLASCYLNSQIA